MQVNGKQVLLEAPMTLTQFLTQSGYRISRIVVERNLEIVPKEQYDTVMLSDSDTLEIITFMGGGSRKV